MVRFLIYFEDIPDMRARVESICAQYFPGYTFRRGHIGYWEGERENSNILEILGEYPDTAKVYRLAEDIRITLAQNSVIVATAPVAVEFVTSGTAADLIARYTHPLDYPPKSKIAARVASS